MSLTDIINQVNGSTVLLLAALIYVIVASLKVAPAFKHNQYLPIVSVVLGLVIGAIIGRQTDIGFLSGLVDGAIAGFVSSGSHELVDSLQSFLGGKK